MAKGAWQAPTVESEATVFIPHPNLDEEINGNICQSEVEGGVHLDLLPAGAVLEVQTCHRLYLLENMGEGRMRICGHPEYCPAPVPVEVHGSTWGGCMIKARYIGRGMHLEFRHPDRRIIRTSMIHDIRERIHDDPERAAA